LAKGGFELNGVEDADAGAFKLDFTYTEIP
jgi:hypothetical protein